MGLLRLLDREEVRRRSFPHSTNLGWAPAMVVAELVPCLERGHRGDQGDEVVPARLRNRGQFYVEVVADLFRQLGSQAIEELVRARILGSALADQPGHRMIGFVKLEPGCYEAFGPFLQRSSSEVGDLFAVEVAARCVVAQVVEGVEVPKQGGHRDVRSFGDLFSGQ